MKNDPMATKDVKNRWATQNYIGAKKTGVSWNNDLECSQVCEYYFLPLSHSKRSFATSQ